MREEMLPFAKETGVQTEDDEAGEEFRMISKGELARRLKEAEALRDLLEGEKKYLKKSLESMKIDYERVLRKVEEKEGIKNE
mmetsp:Transcript_28630/g.21370  ORF Transcript_28630/g.21370 Transcript_28630/m.21370 type:complete len:82 (+) Transcript_28630:122-367(+)|eukprot:CAMPEP_0202966606 /NCGR_PEP_ID=MMETSP1396-20130829/11114_1 /ASSEMBLY_ACC=CAM_ASM_000872 /TAXON_ID= /ORGANISM="Pseudokeronopsis sp., Strain Brazil" /LENGTH=81 /DNA_ID=CAMNT_0049690701 /DNA_START=89 /DNA_END=334 /DNA_ORIENTATION=+